MHIQSLRQQDKWKCAAPYSLSIVLLFVLSVNFRPAAARKFVEDGVKTLEGLFSICLELK